MVPRVKDNNPHGTLKTSSLDFEEEYQAREGHRGNFKISKLILLIVAVILPIRRKTLSNKSINLFVNMFSKLVSLSNNSRRHLMAEILPIRHYPINQSIKFSVKSGPEVIKRFLYSNSYSVLRECTPLSTNTMIVVIKHLKYVLH